MLRRLALAVGALVSVLVLGTVGYMLIERWPLIDALYMTVITIGTVGFREVQPLSRAGQAFTMALILAGVAALGFSFGTIVDFMVEGHLGLPGGSVAWRSVSKRLRDHHIVAGLGPGRRSGRSSRRGRGARFVVIDSCEDCVSRAAERGWLVRPGRRDRGRDAARRRGSTRAPEPRDRARHRCRQPVRDGHGARA